MDKKIIWKVIFGAGGVSAAAVFYFGYRYVTGGGPVWRKDTAAMANSVLASWSVIWNGDAAVPETDPSATVFSFSKTTSDVGDASGPGKETSPAESTSIGVAIVDEAEGPDSAMGAITGAVTKTIPAASSLLVSPSAKPKMCTFSDSGSPTHILTMNEIAWMGSVPENGESAAKAGEREWIELKNTSPVGLDISGWHIMDAAGNIKITLGEGLVPPGGFYLLSRDGAPVEGVRPDAGYTGSLPNGGGELAILDADCGIVDFLDASSRWPAGDNATKQTLERDRDGIGWHTSSSPGGTPRAENSAPVPPQNVNYLISVSSAGNGSGMISSTPEGILCGFTCEAKYASGTKLVFSASPADGSYFKGWVNVCAGAGECSFTISSSVALIADFELVEIVSSTIDTASSTGVIVAQPVVSSSLSLPGIAGHIVIAKIQIAGASSSNDFVKIFNPTDAAVDMSGWKLRKRSSSGADYSLKVFPASSTIAADGYFIWANSEGGFAQSISADVSSTETVSADNSVALFNAAGDAADEVAWGTGMGQYVEGAAYPTNPAANQVLARQMASGTIIDTDDNASDFVSINDPTSASRL